MSNCPMCGGSGRIDRPSFADSMKLVEQSCHVCKGSGRLPEVPITEADVRRIVREELGIYGKEALKELSKP